MGFIVTVEPERILTALPAPSNIRNTRLEKEAMFVVPHRPALKTS
jgi:hypothetical protein